MLKATTIRRRGWNWAGLLGPLLIGLALWQSTGLAGAPAMFALGPGIAASAARPVLTELPPATARFLDAYARGDEVAAESLASPLYLAGWERRGLSVDGRLAVARSSRGSGAEPSPGFRFMYFGGATDARGFGHLLLVARPAKLDGPSFPSIFRVDVDPAGQVIWLEMVWLFAEGTGALRAVVGADLARVPPPPVPCCARVIFGVAADDGRSAYYAYATSPDDSGQSLASRPAAIDFFAVDSDGQLRPGAWTYGQDGGEALPYGERRAKAAWHLQPEDSALLHAYLDSLGG